MAKITDQLQNTAIKVIHSRVTDVLLNTVYEIANLNDEYADTEIYGEVIAADDMADVIQKTKDLFLKLPENLNKELEGRTEYINEINSVREGIMEKHKAVFAYRALCGALEDQNTHRSRLALAGTDEMRDIIPPNNEELVDSVIARIARSYDIPYIVSLVLSKVPLRMARAKYDELISRSLEMLFMDMSPAFIENCKSTFATQLAPRSTQGYGKYFPLIAQSLDELSAFDHTKASEDELEEYSDMIDDIGERIDNTETILNVCYNITNYLEILAVYSIDETYATYDNLIIKDVFYSCIDMLRSDTPEIYTEAIIDKASDLIEELFGEARDYEDTLQDLIQNLGEKQKAALPDDTRLAIQVYNSIVYKYMLEISDGLTALDRNNMQPAGMEEADRAVKETIKMINDTCEALTPAEKKLLKQRFIAQVPMDISPTELRDYLLYAFEGITEENARLVAYGDILEALDDMDLIGFDDEHEHHHDCDCGHDHYHDHDCDCGHDHHHDHDHHHGHDHH